MPRGGTKKQKKRNADKGSHGFTLKVIFHQVNSNLSASVSVNLDYLLLAAVVKRELVDK